MVELKWGRLMKDYGANSRFFTNFDAWRVVVVDDYGVIKDDLGIKVGVTKSGASCCDPNENSCTVSGTWPKGATKFMVVPFANAIAAGEAKRGEFWLPMGVMSNTFVDLTTGASNRHTGKLVIQMDNPQEFAKSVHAAAIMADSLLASLPSGTKKAWIYICPGCITVAPSRRLSDSERRLVAGTLHVDYVLLIPAASKVDFAGAKSIDTSKLTNAMTVHADKAGLKDFKVHSAVAKKVASTPTLGASTTGGESTVTGGASPMAGFSALIMMLAGFQFFA